MPPLTLSRDHARRFLVQRHLLDPARSLPPKPGSVLAVVERLGSLQFDPLEVPGARNHDLVLHARVAGYDRSLCDKLLYGKPGERRLFEAYNKSLNILPVHEMPHYRLAWDRAAARYDAKILRDHAAAKEAILARIEREGPLSTADVSRDLGGPIDWHWAPTSEGRAVLEALFETGRVSIARREGNRRFYDLTERLFPPEILGQRVTREEAARHRLLSRYRGVGLMGAVASSELTSGTGTAAERASILAGLVEDGTLLPAEIEGVRGLRYVLADELPIVKAAARTAKRRSPSVVFLAPLDPLMWDRKLVEAVFGFAYKWEVYVPEAKRQHGYYVLPILFGDRLIGRIEPRIDRAQKKLTIMGITFEPGFAPLEEPGFIEAFGQAIRAYRQLVDANRLAWPRTAIGRSLARALKSFE
ncbi:MAG: crosslink repair DNA glycosylase YcaQ family protein [Minicystis sp.]